MSRRTRRSQHARHEPEGNTVSDATPACPASRSRASVAFLIAAATALGLWVAFLLVLAVTG